MSATLTITAVDTELEILSKPRDVPHEPESREASDEEDSSSNVILSKRRAAVVIFTVAGINFLGAMGSGLLTVALPTMARDVGLSPELLLW